MESQEEQKLKDVFDLCDENHNGYITVDHFKKLVSEYFGTSSEEQIVSIVQLVDPSGKGTINFQDFQEGITKISEVLHIDSTRSRTSSTDSIDTIIPHRSSQEFSFIVAPDTPQFQSTSPNIFDLAHSDNPLAQLSLLPQANQLGQPPTISEDDHDSALSGRSSEINESSRTDITDEENYEDYGESEADLTFASDVSENGSRNGSRRITSAASARKLQRDRDSFGSGDEIIGDIDNDISDLNDKVKLLSDQITDLTKSQSNSETRQKSLKDENSSLVRKIHELEEQLRDVELRGDEKMEQEQLKHRQLLMRQDREKLENLEYLAEMLKKVEKDNDDLKNQSLHLNRDLDKIRLEKECLQERLSDVLEENSQLREDQDTWLSKWQNQQTEIEQERLTAAGLLDELGKELEDLRKYKIDMEQQIRLCPDLAVLPARYQELQTDIQHLQQENRSLLHSNEELNAQLISQCMEEGRTLLQDTSAMSWADEMDNMDKAQLKEALKEQQDVNQRLKLYVDKMLLTIIEKQPSLLEVTH